MQHVRNCGIFKRMRYIEAKIIQLIVKTFEQKCIVNDSLEHFLLHSFDLRLLNFEINTHPRTSSRYSRHFNGNRLNEISHLSSGLEFRRKKLIPGAASHFQPLVKVKSHVPDDISECHLIMEKTSY